MCEPVIGTEGEPGKSGSSQGPVGTVQSPGTQTQLGPWSGMDTPSTDSGFLGRQLGDL